MWYVEFRKLGTMALTSLLVCGAVWAWDYDVRKPDEILHPKWFASDTAPGVWTLNYEDALQKARADGKCTLMLFTGSWWCPYCETMEKMVFKSAAWADYVAENGFYLTMLDFPYRFEVPEGQEYKGLAPDGTNKPGWGFKCWLYDADYLAEIGLSRDAGLQAIERMYAYQNAMAYPTATKSVFDNWNGTGKIEVGKVGYPTIIVFGPDGRERGRVGFPWYRPEDVTESEAQEYMIQAIELLVNGECEICEDPLSGTPPDDSAQTYSGWLNDGESTVAGLVEFKTSKANAKGLVTVSGCVRIAGRRIPFKSVRVADFDEFIPMTGKDLLGSVKFGDVGLSGTITYAGVLYTIGGGGRNVFRAKDVGAVGRMLTSPIGRWNVVMKSAAGSAPFARGSGSLTVEINSKGVAKVSGRLGDGTRVSQSSQLVVGDKGMACLPIRADLYGKRGGFGFVIWFKHGKLLSFDCVSMWKAVGKSDFVAAYTPTSTMSAGYGTISDELELALVDFDPASKFNGLSLLTDPSLDVVVVSKTSWKGTVVSGFKGKCAKRTGELKGTMTFLLQKENGGTKKVTGQVYGVVMGGSCYGTVIVKNVGSWGMKIAVCGGCSD